MERLSDVLSNQHHVMKFEIGEDELERFAINIAETTAKRIIEGINRPNNPLPEKEVCTMLGKSRQTLAKYRKDRKLRYNRIGREIYYMPDQLQEDIKIGRASCRERV